MELGLDGVIARAEAVENEDYFEVLGVADGASVEAVRAAFVHLAETWHPDRLHGELVSIRGDVAKVFSHMSRANETLCDPEARRAYEATRKATAAALVRPRADVIRTVHAAMADRDFDTAIRLTQELIDAGADDAEALAIQAWASVRAGEASEDELRAALAKMEKAVNLDRKDDQAVYHRGLVHKRLDNVPSAFRDFARALQLNPKHLEAEREVRLFAMRARKGSGEDKLAGNAVEELGKK